MKSLTYLLLCFLLSITNTTAQTVVTDSSKLVTVLSFNILHGATTKGDFDLDAIAKVILDSEPDFVALQEVDFLTNRAKNYDLATELGYRTKMAPLFGRAMKYDGGEYGEGVLSKYTFLSTRNVPLPYNEGDEPRAALEITTVLPSQDTISFIGTHLDHLRDESNRINQAKEINRVLSRGKYPSILAGDLNAEPESETMKIIGQMWTPSYLNRKIEFTYSSENPVKKIDYVLFAPANRWKVIETRAICDKIASDHCAYLAVLELLD
jgi:endonuclease/exonuclease/phosphatase family metal-dependent hydrolase